MCYKNKLIGVVVPAFNEELLIRETLMSIPKFVDKIYVVDDCSRDGTAKISKEFEVADPKYACVSHEQNKGVGSTIVTGYKKALDDGMQIIIVMAGDNQMDPKYLPDLIDPIIEGKAEFTKGNRLKPGYWNGMRPLRLFGNILLNILTKIASGYWNINDPQNGYVALNSSSLRKLDLDKLYSGYAFENDMMIKSNVEGIKMANVPIPAKYGKEISKIRYKKFLVKTSMFLFYSFFWRIWTEYIRNFRPIGLLYFFGCFGLLIGLILIFAGTWKILVCGLLLFGSGCLLESRMQNNQEV